MAYADNRLMELQGHVHKGVIVLDDDVSLPDGARVRVALLASAADKQRIECEPGRLPLVRGGTPGSLDLTNERIYEILDAEDVLALKQQRNVSS